MPTMNINFSKYVTVFVQLLFTTDYIMYLNIFYLWIGNNYKLQYVQVVALVQFKMFRQRLFRFSFFFFQTKFVLARKEKLMFNILRKNAKNTYFIISNNHYFFEPLRFDNSDFLIIIFISIILIKYFNPSYKSKTETLF